MEPEFRAAARRRKAETYQMSATIPVQVREPVLFSCSIREVLSRACSDSGAVQSSQVYGGCLLAAGGPGFPRGSAGGHLRRCHPCPEYYLSPHYSWQEGDRSAGQRHAAGQGDGRSLGQHYVDANRIDGRGRRGRHLPWSPSIRVDQAALMGARSCYVRVSTRRYGIVCR